MFIRKHIIRCDIGKQLYILAIDSAKMKNVIAIQVTMYGSKVTNRLLISRWAEYSFPRNNNPAKTPATIETTACMSSQTYGDRSNGSINSLVANRTDQLIHPKMIVLIIGATSFIVL